MASSLVQLLIQFVARRFYSSIESRNSIHGYPESSVKSVGRN